MNVVVSNILNTIIELGYVSIYNRTIVQSKRPLVNVYSDDDNVFNQTVYLNRWNITIQYLSDYVKYHDNFHGDYFVCIYDGWRQNAEYVPLSQNRTYGWLALLFYITKRVLP
jgi:hypothetical protein